jgi:hypothetical protein
VVGDSLTGSPGRLLLRRRELNASWHDFLILLRPNSARRNPTAQRELHEYEEERRELIRCSAGAVAGVAAASWMMKFELRLRHQRR